MSEGKRVYEDVRRGLHVDLSQTPPRGGGGGYMANRDRQLRLHFALSTKSELEAEVYCRRRVNPYRVLRSAA